MKCAKLFGIVAKLRIKNYSDEEVFEMGTPFRSGNGIGIVPTVSKFFEE